MSQSSENSPPGPSPEQWATLEALFADHRARLKQVVSFRMDCRLQGRVDASDVVQEAFLEAAQRYGEYLRTPTISLYGWLRFLTVQQLQIAARRHLRTQSRDVRREVDLGGPTGPEVSAAGLADHILDSATSPSSVAARGELRIKLQTALESLEPIDREILALRHFEQLSNAESAQILNLQSDAASHRYFRALKRLGAILASLGWNESVS
jgi:RNA polymerase sigma-70 factor, ECF subfamily